jgi:ribonuclease D
MKAFMGSPVLQPASYLRARFWDNWHMSHYLFIDRRDEAEELAREWTGVERLAVDTEFVRESTYSARLCLLQLSDGERMACLDMLALDGPGPFAALLANPGIRKVFHSARQDLEVLNEHLGAVPGPVWDTQVAAALLGYPDQVGYTQLTGAELGVTLPKDHARTDWSRRPLSDEQLRYAAADVQWLLPLADRLEAELEQLGRHGWASEESAALCDPALYAFDADGAWRRVKGAGQLEGRALARLEALARWREQEARRRDRPRRWILKDEGLLALAALEPASPDGLARLEAFLPPAVRRRHGERLLALLAAADAAPPPQRAAPARLEPAQDKLARKLMARLRALAEAHRVSAPLLATRKEIEALVLGQRDLPLLSGWRRELAGAELLSMLGPG